MTIKNKIKFNQKLSPTILETAPNIRRKKTEKVSNRNHQIIIIIRNHNCRQVLEFMKEFQNVLKSVHKLKEFKLSTRETKLINETRSNIGRKDTLNIILW